MHNQLNPKLGSFSLEFFISPNFSSKVGSFSTDVLGLRVLAIFLISVVHPGFFTFNMAKMISGISVFILLAASAP